MLGAINALIKVIGAGLSFALYILLARTLSPEAFANVALALTWSMVISVFASLSIPLTFVRFIPGYRSQAEEGKIKGIVLRGLFLSTVATVAICLVGSGIIALAKHYLQLAETAWMHIACWSTLLVTYGLITSGILQSFKLVVTAEILNSLLRTFLLIAVVSLCLVLGYKLDTIFILSVYAMTTFITLVVMVFFAVRLVLPTFRNRANYSDHRLWQKSAYGFILILGAATLVERIDFLMLGFFAQKSEVAIYTAATRFSQTVVFAITAATSVMAPHFSEHIDAIKRGDTNGSLSSIKQTAMLMVGLAGSALLIFILFGHYFLTLFGELYIQAHQPLIILCSGLLAASLAGPAIIIATLLNQTKHVLSAYGIGIVVNVLLNATLTPQMGSSGAAIANACGYTVATLYVYMHLYRCFGLRTNMTLRIGSGFFQKS